MLTMRRAMACSMMRSTVGRGGRGSSAGRRAGLALWPVEGAAACLRADDSGRGGRLICWRWIVAGGGQGEVADAAAGQPCLAARLVGDAVAVVEGGAFFRPDDTASGRGAGLRLRRLTPAGVAQGGLGPALPGQGCLAKSLAGDMRVITVQAC